MQHTWWYEYHITDSMQLCKLFDPFLKKDPIRFFFVRDVTSCFISKRTQESCTRTPRRRRGRQHSVKINRVCVPAGKGGFLSRIANMLAGGAIIQHCGCSRSLPVLLRQKERCEREGARGYSLLVRAPTQDRRLCATHESANPFCPKRPRPVFRLTAHSNGGMCELLVFSKGVRKRWPFLYVSCRNIAAAAAAVAAAAIAQTPRPQPGP